MTRNSAIVVNFMQALVAGFILCRDPPYSPDTIKYIQGTYLILLIDGIVGILHNFNREHSDSLYKTNNFTIFLKRAIAFPLAVTEFWLKHGTIGNEAAWCHSIIAAFVLVLHILKEARNDVVDPLMMVCVVSLSVVSFLNDDYYALAAATVYGLGYSIYRDGRHILKVDSDDWFCILPAGSALLMLYALTGSL